MNETDVAVTRGTQAIGRPSRALMQSVVAILPTYNEAANIGPILQDILALEVMADVLVVDDGSPDGTAELAAAIGRLHPGRAHVLRRDAKYGLGPAYRAGFRWALSRAYDVVVQMDADGSHPVMALTDMLSELRHGADLVIGSRYIKGGGSSNWPASRRMLSRLGNSYARLLLDLPLSDITSGYRCWRRQGLERVTSLLELDGTGYGYLIEMATAAHRLGLGVSEVPIVFKNRERGESKMSIGIALEAMQMVLRLRQMPCRVRGEVGETVATRP